MSERPPKERSWLFIRHIVRKVFLEDWPLKLTGLIITFALWLGVTGLSTQTTTRVTVPLNFSISNNAEITNSPRSEVEISISGDKRKVDLLQKGDLTAIVDLSDAQPGDKLVSLSPETVYVALPQGISLNEVSPHSIVVKLETVAEKDIDVKINTEGEVAQGFEIYAMTAAPPKIRVRGPASFMSAVQFVETEKIDVSGKTEGFAAKQVGVSVSNPKAAVLNTVVDVFFRIGEKRIERLLSVPVTGISGKMASATLYGPKTPLSKARNDSFRVEMVKNDNGEDVPQLTMPAELQNIVEIRKLVLK